MHIMHVYKNIHTFYADKHVHSHVRKESGSARDEQNDLSDSILLVKYRGLRRGNRRYYQCNASYRQLKIRMQFDCNRIRRKLIIYR